MITIAGDGFNKHIDNLHTSPFNFEFIMGKHYNNDTYLGLLIVKEVPGLLDFLSAKGFRKGMKILTRHLYSPLDETVHIIVYENDVMRQVLIDIAKEGRLAHTFDRASWTTPVIEQLVQKLNESGIALTQSENTSEPAKEAKAQ